MSDSFLKTQKSSFYQGLLLSEKGVFGWKLANDAILMTYNNFFTLEISESLWMENILNVIGKRENNRYQKSNN